MIIYKTTNTINGKFYVGQDSKNNPEYLGSGILLNKAIKKYGEQFFVKEILEYCSSKEELNEKEKFWIEKLKAKELGYNVADGGSGGNTYTEETKTRVSNLLKNKFVSQETRQKMSQSRRGFTHTEESKKKMSNAHTGKKLTQEHKDNIGKYSKTSVKSKEFLANIGNIQKYFPKGSKHSEETKKKISEKNKLNPTKHWLGKKFSEETKRKISESNKGRKHSDEFKKRMKGEGNPFYGKKHSPETIQALSQAKKNRTPEQKLEAYKKFFITRMGFLPSDDQLNKKLNEYKNV